MIAPAATHEVALLVDCEVASRMLAISTRSLSRLTVPHGSLRCLRIGNGKRPLLRYAVADLQSWIEAERNGRCTELIGTTTNLQESSNRSGRMGTIKASVAEK